ncbi:MAG: hypothetical protein WA937_03665 [Flavobacteriales bacterium]
MVHHPVPRTARPLAVLTTLFFMWGFMTVMNSVLILQFEAVSSITHSWR